MKQKFYITFGVGTILGKYYLELEAESEAAARRKIIQLMRGNHIWCGCYDEAEFKNNEYGLIKLEIPRNVTMITDYEEKEALVNG